VRQKVLASITFGDGRSVSVAFVIKRTILCKGRAQFRKPEMSDRVACETRTQKRRRKLSLCKIAQISGDQAEF
jgi:hypothetical protein